jgi:hypothetical protein
VNEHLPPGNFFAVWRLAHILDKSREHIATLLEQGEFEGVDMRQRKCSRYSVIIPRASVVAFLERRKLGATQNGHSENGKRAH